MGFHDTLITVPQMLKTTTTQSSEATASLMQVTGNDLSIDLPCETCTRLQLASVGDEWCSNASDPTIYDTAKACVLPFRNTRVLTKRSSVVERN